MKRMLEVTLALGLEVTLVLSLAGCYTPVIHDEVFGDGVRLGLASLIPYDGSPDMTKTKTGEVTYGLTHPRSPALSGSRTSLSILVRIDGISYELQ